MNDKQNLPSKKLADFYNHYCANGCLWCIECRSKLCMRLVRMVSSDRQIFCKFTCDECGESQTYSQNCDELIYLLYRLKYKRPQDTDSFLYTQLRCFSMIDQYPHLLKGGDHSRKIYEKMKGKIETELNNVDRQKRMMKFFGANKDTIEY